MFASYIYIYMLPSYIYIVFIYTIWYTHTTPPHIYTIHLTDISVITVGLIPTRYYFYVQKSIVMKFMLSMNKHHFSLIIFGIPHFLCFLYLLFAYFVMFLWRLQLLDTLNLKHLKLTFKTSCARLRSPMKKK